jgi:hypothetical protein
VVPDTKILCKLKVGKILSHHSGIREKVFSLRGCPENARVTLSFLGSFLEMVAEKFSQALSKVAKNNEN